MTKTIEDVVGRGEQVSGELCQNSLSDGGQRHGWLNV